uniref:Protein Ycf2 n=1 Tax=Anthoceros agrestis TaxID=41834 RepID=A0A6M8AU30_9EMBR|nr:Ycf2 protein [Anthoceros agrestis]QKD76503.1 Ycf2 protein [Anthoceros agrestis]
MKQKLLENKFSYRKFKLEEIKKYEYLLNSCINWNLIKLVTGIPSNREHLIKLFDLRILSSLILRDLRKSEMKKSLILKSFPLLILSMFIHRMNSRNIVEINNCHLERIIYGGINYREGRDEISRRYLHSFMKNFSIPLNYPFSTKKGRERYTNNLLRQKKHIWVFKRNLLGKKYIKPVYDKIDFYNFEEWKTLIIKEILPSWKISNQSIDKANILLEDKNIEDLKHFFELYVDDIIRRDYYWKKSLDIISYRDRKNQVNLNLKNNLEFLDKKLFYCLISAFCEKVLSEVEGPFKHKRIKSTFNLKNIEDFSDFGVTNKEILKWELHWWKNKIFQFLDKNHESDQSIAKSFTFLQNKRFIFLENYAEFYTWLLYEDSPFHLKKDKQLLDTAKDTFKEDSFQLNDRRNKIYSFENKGIFLNILHNFSIYVSNKVRNFNHLKRFFDISKKNSYLINKNLVYHGKGSGGTIYEDEKQKTWDTTDFYLKREKYFISKTDFLSRSIEKKCFKSNKYFLDLFLNRGNINKRSTTESKIHSYDPSSLTKAKRKEVKSGSSYEFLEKDSLFFLMKEDFVKDFKSITKDFFSNREKKMTDYFPKLINYAFLDISSIDESNMSFHITGRHFKDFPLNEWRTNIPSRNYMLSDISRMINLSKIRKKFQNVFFVSSISSKRIRQNKNSNNFYLISLIKPNLSWNRPYLCWSTLYKCNKQYIFNRYLKLKERFMREIEQLNLLITKPNENYDKILYFQVESEIGKFHKSKENELNDKFFFPLLNSINEDDKFLNEMFHKKVEAYSEENFETYIYPTNHRKKFQLWYELNKGSYICLDNVVKKYYFIYKLKFYLINRMKKFWVERIENGNSSNFIRNIVNGHSSNWKRNGREWFDYNIKRDKYINWNSYIYKWFDRTKNLQIFPNWFSDNTSRRWFNEIRFIKPDIFMTYPKKLEKNYYSKVYFIFNTSSNSLLEFISNKKNINLRGRVLHNYKKLSRDSEKLIKNKLVPESFLNKNLIKNIIISLFNNEKNHDIFREFPRKTFSLWIYKNGNNGFNLIKNFQKNLMMMNFHNTNTIEFLDYLHDFHFRYDKRLPFFMKEIHIKNYDSTYNKFLKILPIYSNLRSLSINKIKPFFFQSRIDITLSIQLQVFNDSLSNYLGRTCNYIFTSFTNHLYKLLNLLMKINSSIYKETDSCSIQKFLAMTPSGPTILNFKITHYDEFFLEELTSNFNGYFEFSSEPNLNHTEIQSYKNDLLSESLIEFRNKNNRKLQWIKESFLKLNLKENFKYVIGEKSINRISINLDLYEKNNNILPYSSLSITDFFYKDNKIKVSKKLYFLEKWNFFQNYTSWFFTFEWWRYFSNIPLKTFPEVLLNITDQSKYISYKTTQYIEEILKDLWKNLKFIFQTNILRKININSEIHLLKQINNEQHESIFIYIWSHFRFINLSNAIYLTLISLFVSCFLVSENYFSTLIGLDYIDSWRRFRVIKYLRDPLRGSYLVERWIYGNQTEIIRTENFFMLLLKNLIHYIKNGRFFLFTRKKLDTWLFHSRTLDLSRRKKDLLVKSVITEKSLSQYRLNFNLNHNLRNYDFGYKISEKPGFYYLRYLAETYQKNLVNHSFYSSHLAEKWILLAFWKGMISSQKLWQTKILNNESYRIPIPFELDLFSSKGILLVGPTEIGKSYLIKNLAADSYVPLIKISISKPLYNKPDVITESWINILMESLQRLTLILELAKKMSPCIIWIQDIHELNVNRSTENVESDLTSLLGILLKYFHTEFISKSTKGIIIIGSTHLPRKVDPALISPNRLDKLMNIRIIDIFERQEKFSILLHSKRFYFKNKLLHFNEFAYRTMGYNGRDLVALANEVSLINTTEGNSTIYIDAVRLALHRQTLGFTYINNQMLFCQNKGVLLHKIGKAVIQNIFIKIFPMNPLYIGSDLWKKKFYYLSEWFLEPSVTEPTIKELTLLSYILGCLAGLAAGDSWSILEHESENLIPLNKFIENDFDLACGISESFLVEFSWLEIFQDESINNEIEFFPKIGASHFLNMMQRGISSTTSGKFMYKQDGLRNRSIFKKTVQYKEKLYELASETTWAPKIWRLSFIRTKSFDWIGRPNDFESLYSFWFLREKEQTFSVSENSRDIFHSSQVAQYKKKEELPYERILSRIRRRNVEELESQLGFILSEDELKILGFPELSTQYRIEYELFKKPMLFMGGRFIWDPTSLSFETRYSVFSRRELFIDEEMLRRLYVTYGARRERERSRSSQKIKQFFLRCGYGRDLMNNSSISWWNGLFFTEKYNIEIFKRIEEISVQLKHPEVFTPVYLYQSWLIENSREKLSRFDLLNHRERWIKLNNKSFHYFSIHSTLLESYNYLLNFFISNRILLDEMTKMLLKDGWLFQNEIEHFICKMKK